jgi:hypothetical protein
LEHVLEIEMEKELGHWLVQEKGQLTGKGLDPLLVLVLGQGLEPLLAEQLGAE